MIVAQGLTKYYSDKRAIHDLNFEIADGEIIGILGLNGAGKSTTLRVLSCLLMPSTGQVTIDGLDVVTQPHEVRKLVGFLPEDPPLYLEMTVEDFLCFTGELRGLTKPATRARLEEVLELTHTKEVRRELIGNLSHGFRKRVGIGQAIIHQPKLLILDEPISGLDPVQIVEIREMIKGLRGRHTILVSSHILPEISQTCDRIFVIQSGEIVAAGTEDELVRRLGGRHRLRLVARATAEKVVELVRQVEKVNGCAIKGSDGEIVELLITTVEDVREQLCRTLIQGGCGVLEFSPAEAELETIFLQLTKQARHKTHARDKKEKEGQK